MDMTYLPGLVEFVTLAISHGSGTFILPFIFMQLFIGYPILYMEIFLAQYFRKVSLLAWKMSPIAYGLFMYLQVMYCIDTIKTTLIGGQLIWYIFTCMYHSEPPWLSCNPEYGDMTICYRAGTRLSMDCYAEEFDILCPTANGTSRYQLPATQYLLYSFYAESRRGELSWNLFGCMVIYCIVIFIFLWRKSLYPEMAKYALVLLWVFFFILLLYLLFQSAGSRMQVTSFFQVDPRYFSFTMLYYAFHEVHTGFGMNAPGIFAYSTRIAFKLQPHFHALAIWFIVFTTDVIVSCTTYALLGKLAFDTGTNMRALELPGFFLHSLHSNISILMKLLFLGQNILLATFPHILKDLPLGQMWTIMYFFICLYCVLMHHVVNMSGNIQNMVQTFDWQDYRVIFAAAYCILMCGTSIPLNAMISSHVMTEYFMNIFERRTSMMGFACEVIVVFWFYGVSRLSDDIYFTCGSKPTEFCVLAWKIIPYFGLVMVTFGFLAHEIISDGISQAFIIGIRVASYVMISLIPLLAIVKIFKYANKQSFSALFEPTPDWGPPNRKLRENRKRFRPETDIPSQRQQILTFNTQRLQWYIARRDLLQVHPRKVYNSSLQPETVKYKKRETYFY